ncbi:MAG: ABC transporter permease, partial [Gammaproteobacteria bacterium]|nr:ABC transporter permease [Gammaproteobacteria bacterium]
MLLLKLAFRNILRQKRRTLLTGMSMAGGYFLLCLSLSLIYGSYGRIIEHFIRDQTGHIQIHKAGYLEQPRLYKTLDNQESIGKILAELEGVLASSWRIKSQALAFAGDRNTPVQIRGVDIELEPEVSTLKMKVNEGNYFTSLTNPEDDYEALIGRSVADSLHLSVGDQFIMLSQGADGSMANDLFIVSGITGTRNSRDRLTIYLPLGVAQEFFSMPGRINEIAVIISDTDDAKDTNEKLNHLLGPGVESSDWQEVEETFYKTMEADKRGDRVMLGIIIFIVFVGVLNTVLMSVLERTREFGVLKSIGTRPQSLMALISTETLLLALLSCIVGFMMSAPLIYWFSESGIALAQPIDIG